MNQRDQRIWYVKFYCFVTIKVRVEKKILKPSYVIKERVRYKYRRWVSFVVRFKRVKRGKAKINNELTSAKSKNRATIVKIFRVRVATP